MLFSLFLFGCSERPREFLYPDALLLFRVGMSSEEVEKVYGSPQIVNGYSGEISWTYIPKKMVERGRPGDLEGFIIEFKDGRSIAIKKYIITIGSPY